MSISFGILPLIVIAGLLIFVSYIIADDEEDK